MKGSIFQEERSASCCPENKPIYVDIGTDGQMNFIISNSKSIQQCCEVLVGWDSIARLQKRIYSYVPHNDVSANDGPHIRRLSHNIKI